MSRHIIIIIHCTNLKTQSCPGYLKLILRLSALGRKLWFQLFFLIKVDPLNLESLGSPEFPDQIWGKSVQGFLSYNRTNKETDIKANRDYNFSLYYILYYINSSKKHWENVHTITQHQYFCQYLLMNLV